MDHADKAAKPKKRRTGQIVFLCILLLLLAVLGGVVWRYRAGLAILIDNFGKSSEQVSAEREDYEKKTQALLDKLSGGGITLAALSEADRARLKNGEITPAEAVAIIMGLAGSTAARPRPPRRGGPPRPRCNDGSRRDDISRWNDGSRRDDSSRRDNRTRHTRRSRNVRCNH